MYDFWPTNEMIALPCFMPRCRRLRLQTDVTRKCLHGVRVTAASSSQRPAGPKADLVVPASAAWAPEPTAEGRCRLIGRGTWGLIHIIQPCTEAPTAERKQKKRGDSSEPSQATEHQAILLPSGPKNTEQAPPAEPLQAFTTPTSTASTFTLHIHPPPSDLVICEVSVPF